MEDPSPHVLPGVQPRTPSPQDVEPDDDINAPVRTVSGESTLVAAAADDDEDVEDGDQADAADISPRALEDSDGGGASSSPKSALKGTINRQPTSVANFMHQQAALAAKQDSKTTRFSLQLEDGEPDDEASDRTISVGDSPRGAQVRKSSSRISQKFRQSMHSMSDMMPAMSSVPTLTAADKVKGVLGCLLGSIATWFVLSSILLILFGVQYDSLVVDDDRERYVSSTVERAASAAANVMFAGLAARDAVDYAIRNKLYYEPMDYETVRVTLEPVFAGFPPLRSVDLAFTDRNVSITTRRLLSGEEDVASFMSTDRTQINVHLYAALAMQSSKDDCQEKLGDRGCLRSFPASTQRWHRLASNLWGGEEKDGFKQPGEEVFRWDDRPGFVPADPSRSAGSNAKSIAWSPAYSLIFRSPFPGSSGKLSVLGRSVIDLADLRADEELADIALGSVGAIYICNRAGQLLASNAQGEQVFVQGGGGVWRYRHISELDAKWTDKLQNFDGQEQTFTSDGFYVAIQPLRGYGLGNFSAVVAAQRDSFVDSRLSPLLEGSKVVAVLPYPVFLMVILGFQAYREWVRRRNLRRVHVLHRGIATLVHEAAPDEMGDGDTGQAMTALRKRIRAKQVQVARDAKLSMDAYIEVSARGQGQKKELIQQLKIDNQMGNAA